MRNKVAPILLFTLGQVASIAVLTLWVVFHTAIEFNIWWLLQGILLMMLVIGGLITVFVYWTKLRTLDKERATFISGMSHELLTPLASLRLYIETIQMRDLNESKRREFLQLMLKDSERLASSISSILNASRIEEGRMLYKFTECDFAETVSAFIEANSRMLGGADIALDLEQGCACMIDNEAFNMLLKNLLQNAIRYSPEPAKIIVTLKKDKNKDKILLVIKDEGVGLDKKELTKIFKMFYRVSKTKHGTGLGLYIVSTVVKAHKGKIWAESDSQNKGATFNVLLPCVKNGSKK